MKGQQRLLYLLPACILVFAFFLFPLAYLSYISFFEWDGLGPKTFVLLHIPFGLLLALLLNRKPRGWKVFRVMYFIPNVISTTAIAFLWYFIYHVDVGLLNNMLNAVGLKKLTHAWLNDPTTALWCNLVH